VALPVVERALQQTEIELSRGPRLWGSWHVGAEREAIVERPEAIEGWASGGADGAGCVAAALLGESIGARSRREYAPHPCHRRWKGQDGG
jgi:hypothetical protein